MLAWIFLFVVLAFVGKLVYDVQQKKNKPTQTEDGFDKDALQKLAGIKPTNPNDEIRQILVKNNIFAKEQIVEALLKAAENSEFPKPDETINVRTTKITTIDTNFGSDNDPLASIPMSRVSKEAKQKMAEIAKQDISDRLDAQTKQMLESELGPVIDELAKEVLGESADKDRLSIVNKIQPKKKNPKTKSIFPESVEYTEEYYSKVPAKCGCGRSETGFCTGLHKIPKKDWAAGVREIPAETQKRKTTKKTK
jgi:hypothetical protein